MWFLKNKQDHSFRHIFCSRHTLRKHKWFNSASCCVLSVVFGIKSAWHFTGLKTDQHANRHIMGNKYSSPKIPLARVSESCLLVPPLFESWPQ